MHVYDFIADQHVSDSGLHNSAAASLPVQPSTLSLYHKIKNPAILNDPWQQTKRE